MQPLGVDEPTAVGPYRLLGRLGSGGMGRVYLGRSAGGRTVAVKIVHPHFALDEEFRARFRREVEAARRVGGAWTAPVLDADPEAPVPWVATGYAAGPSLTAAVADAGPLPDHSVRALGAGLAEALTAVHALGLVHRDVKPSNVLLTLDGPLLIDFGIARATDGTASLTSTGVSVGSPGYMSPEQILGKGVTGAADVFSLGAVLAYAATGEPPFPGDSSASLLYMVVHEEPRLDAVEGTLRDLVAACLAKEPTRRPTPEQIAARLAPQGAARLVTAGWLPGPLVEQVSRSAVQLLNLDAAGSGGSPASGVVGFSSPAVETGAAGPGDTGGAGAFGPPGSGAGAPSAGTDPGRSAAAGAPVPGFGPPPPGFGPPPATAPRPPGRPDTAAGALRDAGPRDRAPGEPEPDRPGKLPAQQRPGKVSVSVAATSGPGTDGRGRRTSCTVALAVAGALAAVTVGSAFLFDLLPGTGSGGRDSAAGSAPTAPGDAGESGTGEPSAGATAAEPAPTGGTPGASGRPTAVPASYLGTWEGNGLGLGGTLPMGTFRVTVHQAAVGEELGTFRQTDQIGGVCDDTLILKKVTDRQILATSVAAASNRDVCTTGRHAVRLTPASGTLTYETDNAEAGDPVARMTRVE
ncbi:serine/threonine-protein kinase [Streptomyces sp. NPDC048566]|uniref:serine/threonine-protein kinase n=1 Tax=Streptomyces sp. NPDC048566 TaxID=3365569 RepID=UPI00371429DF